MDTEMTVKREKKPAQILFCKNIYSPKVKVEHWTNYSIAQKKDHEVYRDQLSNHISTYDRMGVDANNYWKSQTQVMLEQVFTKTKPVYSFKPLVNFTSYPCTDTPGRNKLMKTVGLAQLPPDFGVMDYITIHQDDYRNPYPSVFKPITMESPTWLLNRVIRSDLTQNGGTAPPAGKYQFLDIHTPIGHIRKLKLHRYQSFDPGSGLQDFPNVNLQ